MSNKYHKRKVNHIHSVSSLGEHLDDKILVFLLPSSHDRLLIRVNDRSDIACNIFLLSALLMKGHPERGKRHNGIPYIDFRAACNAYVKVWKAKIDKLLQELKDAGRVRRLIEGVHDEVDGTLIRKCEHLFQAFCQDAVTGSFPSTIVNRIKLE
jgi:hypothetical protein